MEQRKLLIADASEEFCAALAERLKGTYTVRICQEGQQTLRILCSWKPDILVVDLMLPGLDGISLLQQAAENGLRPKVLATTRFANDYVVESVNQMGVDYIMVKPCDIRATAMRIADLSQHLKPPTVSQPDSRTAVSNILLMLNMPTKLKGFAGTREAVLEFVRDPAQQITKELYPKVAKLYDGNARQVERTIRSAINAAWERRDEQVWRMYFPPDRNGVLRRPSNGAFITGIANHIQMNLEGEGR